VLLVLRLVSGVCGGDMVSQFRKATRIGFDLP
jgi:hypothetical protein